MLPQFTHHRADSAPAPLQISQLFTPYTGFWDAGASLTQTLFDAGRAAAPASAPRTRRSIRRPRSIARAVILACQNVADTLQALQADADALEASGRGRAGGAADVRSRAAAASPRHASARWRVLNAEQTYQQAELALVQAQANRYADTAALFQALGGGWWNRPKEPQL